ncbi:MAG: hypothetical protein EZS28_005224 [Streblomastix strix]|uniref:Uncharacterized protein n=1 Tax=Streblomastix strix TaxID=222440 RepID=A0A5J4WWG1_9EUKA|nr:MAG: hypothetical protein EZS28_005224 [Streblomastix strix]
MKLRYDLFDRRSESRQRSGSKGYSRSRDYQSSRETRTEADRNYNRFEPRNEPRGRGRATFRGRDQNYQGREQSYQDRDQPYLERYREAQQYNPYTKQIFNKTKNPINWNRTHQYDNKNRGKGWDDNPNNEWIKRTQLQQDPLENHSDRNSSWTENEVLQNQITTPQPKLHIQQTQRIQQKQVQSKQQTPIQIPRQRC